MNSEEQAFIAAINSDPWNFGLRCIYADWLDDHDDPRAGPMRELAEMGKVPAYTYDGWTWYIWSTQDEAHASLRRQSWIDEKLHWSWFATPFEAIDAVVRYRLTRLAQVPA